MIIYLENCLETNFGGFFFFQGKTNLFSILITVFFFGKEKKRKNHLRSFFGEKKWSLFANKKNLSKKNFVSYRKKL